MANNVILGDAASLEDLRVFLERAERFGDGAVRVIANAGVLAVYTATQTPVGILDDTATVLGLRTFALAEGSVEADTVVTPRSLLDRIARLDPSQPVLPLPEVTTTAAWAGVLPPRGGWAPTGAIDAASLASVAEAGITRVAEALPTDPGEALVTKVRRSVWGAEIAPGVPASAAFAAQSLGFLGGEEPSLPWYRSGAWTRITTSRGHVLFRGYRPPATS
ncbi:hypothetical protein [Leucobacter sp. M11]|uniref:hypothetical protein n=1 Tax=Leucobacter sp. M11 TaxID=2993565 RepID=UPI002D7F2ED9|nr:hypothetical protein [Leucobacter sp. M11]MEB4616613.1 hypothetical protein [Leucobacter sp. M11]